MITTIFEAIVKSDRNGRGAAGETLAQDVLSRAGYHVLKHHKRKHGDLRAIDCNTGEFWDIEVKTSARRPDGKWIFQLITKGTDYRHADYVFLVAIMPGGITAHYLIPVEKIERTQVRTITISNLNGGRWSQFRVKRSIEL